MADFVRQTQTARMKTVHHAFPFWPDQVYKNNNTENQLNRNSLSSFREGYFTYPAADDHFSFGIPKTFSKRP